MQVRVQDREYESFKEAADASGLELSSWVRQQLLLAAKRDMKRYASLRRDANEVTRHPCYKGPFPLGIVERTEEGYASWARKCPAPKSYKEPDALAWYRERVQTIIRQHDAKTVAVRFAETLLRSGPPSKALPSMYRAARIEGVVIEAAGRRDYGWHRWLAEYFFEDGTQSAKAYTESGELRGMQISELPDEAQEAIAAAASMLGRCK